MIDLPKLGDRVYVWPHPGLKVQDGSLPISDGGRWMPPPGRSVIWDEYRYRQLLVGELHLTDPAGARAPTATPTAAWTPAPASARAVMPVPESTPAPTPQSAGKE